MELFDAQEKIYQYLINLVKNSSPEAVLAEFEQLFISGAETLNSEASKALYELIFHKDEMRFRNTLKRSCYILINNWSLKREYIAIRDLVHLLKAGSEQAGLFLSRSKSRLREWLKNFVQGPDYQELELFALPHINQIPTDSREEEEEENRWSERYADYLFVPQYLTAENPIEQREVARNLSARLREEYKFNLAMYAARQEIYPDRGSSLHNPTRLGADVIQLIKQLVSKHLLFNYINHARIFLGQIEGNYYGEFKQNLQKYLVFYLSNRAAIDILNRQLSTKLNELYQDRDRMPVDAALLVRTCRNIIEFLTTEDRNQPSQLFIALATQDSPLALIVVLLKTILICKHVRNHLDVCIAYLIRYYEDVPASQCQWFINFLEMLNIVLAIYTENIRYNLVKVGEDGCDRTEEKALAGYRIFPQLVGADLHGADLHGTNLSHTNLSNADLRGADLHSADLSGADLSLAKLSNANLSGAILKGTNLVAADLSGANLSAASLNGADLRRAVLRQANLARAYLTSAKLRRADLCKANLDNATLDRASLYQADLSDASLSQANLYHANLTEAQLNYVQARAAHVVGATLHGAEIVGADFSEANLNYAQLDAADLQQAVFSGARLNRTSLVSAIACGANFQAADCSHADYQKADLSQCNFSQALLRYAKLQATDLQSANLTQANLFSANLTGSNLCNTLISNVAGLSEDAFQDCLQRGAIAPLSEAENSSTTSSSVEQPNASVG